MEGTSFHNHRIVLQRTRPVLVDRARHWEWPDLAVWAAVTVVVATLVVACLGALARYLRRGRKLVHAARPTRVATPLPLPALVCTRRSRHHA
jgi:hypothetical protein